MLFPDSLWGKGSGISEGPRRVQGAASTLSGGLGTLESAAPPPPWASRRRAVLGSWPPRESTCVGTQPRPQLSSRFRDLARILAPPWKWGNPRKKTTIMKKGERRNSAPPTPLCSPNSARVGKASLAGLEARRTPAESRGWGKATVASGQRSAVSGHNSGLPVSEAVTWESEASRPRCTA